MTLVVSIQVNDGIVLAADSASSMVRTKDDGTQEIVNVYNNASKVFNLIRTLTKSLPVGAATFGAGSIGPASISTLAKDFRKLISQPNDPMYVDPGAYTVEEIANHFRDFIFSTKCTAEYGEDKAKWPDLGFIIAGYSSGCDLADVFGLATLSGETVGPISLSELGDNAIQYYGIPEPVDRLLNGVDTRLAAILQTDYGLTADEANAAFGSMKSQLQVRLESPAMPIQDAIDLAEFLVDLTEKYMRFSDGHQTVGGPIEIAAITKHEDFKWIRRKHFYDRKMQPI